MPWGLRGSPGGGANLLDTENTWTEPQTFEGLEVGVVGDLPEGWGAGFSTGPYSAAEDTDWGTDDYGLGIASYGSEMFLSIPTIGAGAIAIVGGLRQSLADPINDRYFDLLYGYFHQNARRAILTLYDGITLVSAEDADYDTNSGWPGNPETFQGSGGTLQMGECVNSGDSIRETVPSGYCRFFAEDNGSGKTRLRVKWDDQTVSTLLTQP
jgi:hypothetical protein